MESATLIALLLAVCICGQVRAGRWGSHSTDEDEAYECSRIEFVQRTLERLIMCEMKVAELEETLGERIDSLNATLESEVANLGARMDGLEAGFNAQLGALNGQVASNSALINLILDTLDASVGFNVFDPASDDLPVGGSITFTQVINNVGNGYDVSTGIFTAPVAGIYIFSTTLCPPPNQYLRVAITRNGSTDLVKAGWIDSQYSCGSASAVANLDAGDQITVRNSYTEAGAIAQNEVRSNTFTGALIYPILPV